MKHSLAMLAGVACLTFAFGTVAPAQQNNMSFFVTSAGLGKGGDLGGLEGADKQCQSLAQAAGAGDKTWHAYLSTQGANSANAKDRIGKGPWSQRQGRADCVRRLPTCTAAAT